MAVSPVLAAEVAGEAVKVQPNATLKNPEGSITLQVGTDVKMGDLIRTNTRGEAQLIFTDETKLVVGPNSSLVVESYLLRSKNRANNFTVRALGGTFRMISGKSAKSAYTIKTPTATIGIRGTTFDLAVWNRGRTDFFLYSGAAQFCGSFGTCMNITASCEVARAQRFRGVRQLDNEDDVVDSLAQRFPYFGNDQQLAPGFRARATGCNDDTISKVTAARANSRSRGNIRDFTRDTGNNDDNNSGGAGSFGEADPPEEPDNPDSPF